VDGTTIDAPASNELLTPAAAAGGRPPSRQRQAAFGFIYIASVMNALSFGLMIPVLPGLIRSFFGGTTLATTAAAADWQFVFTLTWGLMQFVSGPVLGMVSDRFGRRPVLLISIFGLSLDFLVMAFSPTLAWLLLGRVVNGATAASFSTANAYVADIATPESRARYFGWMNSAFSVGFLLGPTVGGLLATTPVHIGPFALAGIRTPFLVAAALCAVNWVYGFFVLPESLPVERRLKTFQWRRANPLASLALLRSHRDLLPLATINFLNQLAQQVLPGIFVLYTQLRYNW
jgi:DHA1 family tetracycline resistance protein-like MFS transporter